MRGLKSTYSADRLNDEKVAPLAGAWIEMFISSLFNNFILVAPLAGAWIEISTTGWL